MRKTHQSEWLFFAEQDLRGAHGMLEIGVYHLSCFQAHQAMEKLLKARIVACGKLVPQTHNLTDLYELVSVDIAELSSFLPALKSLDRYYLPTRYPDVLPGSLPEGLPNEDDAKQAIADVEALFHFIRPLLEPHV